MSMLTRVPLYTNISFKYILQSRQLLHLLKLIFLIRIYGLIGGEREPSAALEHDNLPWRPQVQQVPTASACVLSGCP
jgi:hypothetical protein